MSLRSILAALIVRSRGAKPARDPRLTELIGAVIDGNFSPDAFRPKARCIPCGRYEEGARASGCHQGPCPMAAIEAERQARDDFFAHSPHVERDGHFAPPRF